MVDKTVNLDTEIDKVKKKVVELEKKLDLKVSEGKTLVRSKEHDVEQYVKTNPMQAVGIAFALGFFLGKLSK
ncbi:MAG: DUF883 C-terminal domain-containing protein [Candidatus Micrarchaeota archaeon]